MNSNNSHTNNTFEFQNTDNSGKDGFTKSDPVFEYGRQQEVLVSKGRYITFTLPEICSLLEYIMIQQGDESVVSYEEINWNLVASQIDRDPFEVEYFWENFDPNTHYKPTLGFAIMPFTPPPSAIEQKLIASNSDTYSNYKHNLTVLRNYKQQQNAKRDKKTFELFDEFTKSRVKIFASILKNC